MTDIDAEHATNVVPYGDGGDVEEFISGTVVPPAQDFPDQRRPVIQLINVVAKHDHTKTAGRNAVYIGLGAAVAFRRLWDSRSTARYERFMRAAESAGSHEIALEWEARLSSFRNDRHERRMDWITTPVQMMLLLPKIAAGSFAVLGVLGIFLAIAEKNIAAMATPFVIVAKIVLAVGIVISVSWGPFVLAAPWIICALLWWTGKQHANANMTGWLAPKKDDDETGIVITADTIVLGLQNLRIPEMKKAFKDGWRPTFHTSPVRDGRGYSAVFSVPLGVTPSMMGAALLR